jgi:hypothetical protein
MEETGAVEIPWVYRASALSWLVYHEALEMPLLAKVNWRLRDYGAALSHLMLFRSFRIRNITHSCAETGKMD